MRTFKFRAWDKKEKAMASVENLNFEFNMANLHFFHDYFKDNVDLNEVELMQFIGLKDRKGVEIYEGDIIKAKTVMQNMPIWIGEVMRECDYYGVDKNQDTGWVIVNKKLGSCMAFYPEQDREIIGNIYENTELIGGKNE